MTILEGSGAGGDLVNAPGDRTRLIALNGSLRWYDMMYGVRDDVLKILPSDVADIERMDDQAIEATWREVVSLFRRKRLEPLLSFPGVDSFAPRTIAERLAGLTRSLSSYDLLSNGVQSEILQIVPPAEGEVLSLDDDKVASACGRIVSALRERRLEPVLTLHRLPYPRYPVGAEDQSAPTPPVWDPPPLPGPKGGWKVLGKEVGFPIGIPSCDLTANANWIEYYAKKGFHILTYRTVRGVSRPGDRLGWVFVDGIDKSWEPGALPKQLRHVRHWNGSMPPDLRTISTATSYLAPSLPPKVWRADVMDARRRLDELGGYHLLIVSVTDSVKRDEKTEENLTADFVDVSRQAEDAGADAIECYLARCNVDDGVGGQERCELNVQMSIAIVRAVRAALRPTTKLLIKLSADLPDASMEELVRTLAEEGQIDGVSGISPVEVEDVTTDADRPLWKESRPAVAGYAIRALSQSFVKRLAAIRTKHNLIFDIIAMGGVMTPEDVAIYMGLGASAVQTATAAVFDPNLAETASVLYGQNMLPTVMDVWDGFIETVDHDTGTFWARVTTDGGATPDMDVQFELSEIHPDERSEVREGAFFRWETGLIEVCGRWVRQSLVRLIPLDPPTQEQIEAGRKLARKAAAAFGPMPDGG